MEFSRYYSTDIFFVEDFNDFFDIEFFLINELVLYVVILSFGAFHQHYKKMFYIKKEF